MKPSGNHQNKVVWPVKWPKRPLKVKFVTQYEVTWILISFVGYLEMTKIVIKVHLLVCYQLFWKTAPGILFKFSMDVHYHKGKKRTRFQGIQRFLNIQRFHRVPKAKVEILWSFGPKLSVLNFSWALPPKCTLVSWLVRKHQISVTARWIFLIFCMKSDIDKRRKVTEPDFW